MDDKTLAGAFTLLIASLADIQATLNTFVDIERQHLIQGGMSEQDASQFLARSLKERRTLVYKVVQERLNDAGLQGQFDQLLHNIDPGSPAH